MFAKFPSKKPKYKSKSNSKPNSKPILPSKENMDRARKLEEASLKIAHSRNHHKKGFPISWIRKWASQINLLLMELNYDKSRLDKVLNWYIVHCTKKYTPKITDGEKFRHRFSEIEAAMNKWELDNPQEKVEKWAQDFCVDYFMYPQDKSFSLLCRKNFPLALQRTFYNYLAFYEWVQDHPKYSRLIWQLAAPKPFLHDWWEQWGWKLRKNFKLDPLKLIFRLDRPATEWWFTGWGQYNDLDPVMVNQMLRDARKEVPLNGPKRVTAYITA
jgi:hypothetical protein